MDRGRHVRAQFVNLVLVLALLAAASWAYSERSARQEQTRRLAAETHLWACSFKSGLRFDYLATRRFAIAVRVGDRKLPQGFTQADIRDAQRRRLDRLDEMRTLDC